MTVGNGNTQALSCDAGGSSLYDLIAFDLSPYLERLLLGLFFLTADVRDKVIDHFRPCLESFSCAGDSLICAGENLCYTELAERGKSRNVALYRAV